MQAPIWGPERSNILFQVTNILSDKDTATAHLSVAAIRGDSALILIKCEFRADENTEWPQVKGGIVT